MKKIFSILSVVALLLSTFGIPITVNAESPKNTPAFVNYDLSTYNILDDEDVGPVSLHISFLSSP